MLVKEFLVESSVQSALTPHFRVYKIWYSKQQNVQCPNCKRTKVPINARCAIMASCWRDLYVCIYHLFYADDCYVRRPVRLKTATETATVIIVIPWQLVTMNWRQWR